MVSIILYFQRDLDIYVAGYWLGTFPPDDLLPQDFQR